MTSTAGLRLSLLFALVVVLLAVSLARLPLDRAAALPTAVPEIAFTRSDGNIAHAPAQPDAAPTDVTADRGEDKHPAFSPDGQQIAFIRYIYTLDSSGTQSELFRVNADGAGLQRLTDNDVLESWPAWSPDGAHIAFAAGDLYVMSISAGPGEPARLTTGNLNPQHIVWSPDSARLAFNSWPCGGDGECPTAELYVYTLATGQLTRLTNNDQQDTDPAWSPDGARLVYEAGPNESADLYLVPAGGGTATPLVSDEDHTYDPAWSPDGTHIAYGNLSVSTYGQVTYELVIIQPDGANKRVFEVGVYDSYKYEPIWAADSQSLYLIVQTFPSHPGSGSDYTDLVKVDLASPDSVVTVAGLYNDYPSIDITLFALSIPGQRLVFTSYEGLVATDLPPLAQTHDLTHPAPINGDPAWSPAGNAIAYNSHRDGDYNVYAVDADGQNRRALTTHPGNDWNPTWSRHNRIAFTSNRDGNWELYTMNADGGNQTNLTHSPTAEADPAWSPNGARLAFARQVNGNWDIYVMNADGSGATRLTSHAAADRAPAWSPDGKRIAFTTDRDGNDEIYVLAVAGAPGQETNLTHSPDHEREPAWSPDGTTIAFSRVLYGTTSAVFQMNADGSSQIRLFDAGQWPQPTYRPQPPLNLPPRAWTPIVVGAD